MNPKLYSVIGVCLVASAVGVVLQVRNADQGPPAPDVSAEGANQPRDSDRQAGSLPAERPAGLESAEDGAARAALMMGERDRMLAEQVKQAASGFAQTKKHLLEDLELDGGQVGELDRIFARREAELARLLGNPSAMEGREAIRKLCGLIRNKGLRDDLVGVLSDAQLAAFDAREAKRRRETVEAQAYRSMSEINAVVPLDASQKQEVLGVLLEQAPDKVEKEADARAFMSLTYGALAADMDSAHVRGLANMMNLAPGRDHDFEFGSAEYQQWVEEQNAERIASELSILRAVLDDDQLARYREHLEAELPR